MQRVVTCPTLFDWASIPSAAARAMTFAFLGLKVPRVVDADVQCQASVLLELILHNSLISELQFRTMCSDAA